MPRGKKHGAEEIIPKLREAEVVISQGGTNELAAKQIGVSVQTFLRWPWGQESSPHWKALFSLAFNSPSRSHFGRLTTRFVSPMLIALWRHSIEDTS